MIISTSSYALYLFHNNLGCLLIKNVNEWGLSTTAQFRGRAHIRTRFCRHLYLLAGTATYELAPREMENLERTSSIGDEFNTATESAKNNHE